MFYVAIIPFFGDIEITVATSVFLYVLFPIDTGADDVFVFFPGTTGKSARTRHVAIPLLVDKQGPK